MNLMREKVIKLYISQITREKTEKSSFYFWNIHAKIWWGCEGEILSRGNF